jgi:hypothetical protein
MKTLVALAATAFVAMGALGCDVGDPPSDKPTFSRVNEEILKPNCTFACHSGGVNAAGGLDLSKDPRGQLVDTPPTAFACSGVTMKRIAPGDPDASLVWVKIMAKEHGTDPICGDVMPPGDDTPPLTADETTLLHDWIAAGALDD